MKKVAIIGHSGFGRTVLANSTTDSTPVLIIANSQTEAISEIKNYRVDPVFVPSPKIRSKYKRNLKYR